MITIATLVACGVLPTQARTFAEPLSEACQRFGITTKPAVAALISQAMHESVRFTRMEEDLFYRNPERIADIWPSRFHFASEAARFARNPRDLANFVYAGKNGNGPVASGDGWAYRGRGPFQLTGRKNYLDAGAALGLDLVSYPKKVAEPGTGCLVAAWWFVERGCLAPAQNSDVRGVTRAINGSAMLGLGDRMAYFDRSLEALA